MEHGAVFDVAEGVVDVWCLSADSALALTVERALAPGEASSLMRNAPTARAAMRAIVSRGFQRLVVSRYLGLLPHEVRFWRTADGKICVEALGFNTSHSGDLVCCLVARDRDVGIDIEHIPSLRHVSDVHLRFLTARERAAHDRRVDRARETEFLRYWTAKEAVAKALGRGLEMPLKRIEIVFTCPNRARVRFCGQRAEDARLSVRALSLPSEYIGAVCAPRRHIQLRYLDGGYLCGAPEGSDHCVSAQVQIGHTRAQTSP